ncbi:two-component system response regulator RssB [Cronobacter sakazakii]|uniref:two-component system response regulator RssB n=1 Tax=Cronobacter sakazakii TaxID=28141 RepID=UPI0009B200A3|nr:two-component system response regulator RssB [Cronobacter sakazakii]MDQ1931207.1 two-component system response regulator RssB [Cronobacter sakazakii]MDQ1934676.1 two-component system response regulator RssB [Cronobacter sakazakii]MDQ1938953.1 two-component system response regulator RssB [Cronobacter sakazakii]MDQ1943312.1 two-component system response regulator RssB [Cronobacter sakazakii]MDQ1947707.1 two-component system response regulator RssB [Cronobacter sakazakii]
MTQPFAGKQILIVEDEAVFRSMLDAWLSSLGAQTHLAEDGVDALEQMHDAAPDLLICDLEMPRMNGLKLIERLRNDGNQTPILVISATDNMADIAKALRLGVQDVLLKPVKDFNRLRETVYACLYPNMFNSRVEEEERLFQDWDALVNNPHAAAKLLKELQPPVQQVMSHCRVNYRQLVAADELGLVLDIAPISDNDLAFYCLDVTRAGDNGVLAALLLRALFNGLLQEQLSQQRQRLPELGALLKQVNQLLRQANLYGQFPLLVGYYHSELKNLILVSAGLNATLNTGDNQIQLSNGVPLGTLGNTYLNQISQRCEAWQCQVWGAGGRLRLMLSAE